MSWASFFKSDKKDDKDEKMNAIEDRTVFVDKAMTNNLEGLNTILTQFSKNDTQGIVDKIKSMPEFKNQLPKDILDKVSSVHKSILDTLDQSLTDEEKKKQLEGDGNIVKFIQRYVDKELDDKMQDYLQNPFIKNDQVVQKSMVSVTNSIKNIRGKYKYFEYKYVQMNVFLILFTKHVHTTIKKFIDETSAFYTAREKYHLVLIHNVIKIFEEQLGTETKNFADLDTTKFSTAIKELTQSVMNSISQQKEMGEKMKQDSLADILKFLMERESDFASEIIKSVDGYKAQNPKNTTSTTNTQQQQQRQQYEQQQRQQLLEKQRQQYEQQQQQRPLNNPFIPSSTFTGNKYGYKFTKGPLGQGYYLNSSLSGGFIRDGSKLPQTFYKL